MARLQLLRGELTWLTFDLDGAEHHANAALSAFEKLDDRIGAGDAKWLLASIIGERGNFDRFDEYVTETTEDYRAGGDQDRVQNCIARGSGALGIPRCQRSRQRA